MIAHLPADEPDDLMRTARALSNAGDLAAIELGLPTQSTPQDIRYWIDALRAGCELPLLVKLPLRAPVEIAQAAVDSFADALVLGTPPLGTKLTEDKQYITGHLFGSYLHSLVLHNLQRLLDLSVPLVAVGGIHRPEDAHAYLNAGAAAIQLDSLLFVDPKRAGEIAKSLTPSQAD